MIICLNLFIIRQGCWRLILKWFRLLLQPYISFLHTSLIAFLLLFQPVPAGLLKVGKNKLQKKRKAAAASIGTTFDHKYDTQQQVLRNSSNIWLVLLLFLITWLLISVASLIKHLQLQFTIWKVLYKWTIITIILKRNTDARNSGTPIKLLWGHLILKHRESQCMPAHSWQFRGMRNYDRKTVNPWG